MTYVRCLVCRQSNDDMVCMLLTVYARRRNPRRTWMSAHPAVCFHACPCTHEENRDLLVLRRAGLNTMTPWGWLAIDEMRRSSNIRFQFGRVRVLTKNTFIVVRTTSTTRGYSIYMLITHRFFMLPLTTSNSSKHAFSSSTSLSEIRH